MSTILLIFQWNLQLKLKSKLKKNEKYQVAIIGTNIGAKHFEDFQKVSENLMFTHYVV